MFLFALLTLNCSLKFEDVISSTNLTNSCHIFITFSLYFQVNADSPSTTIVVSNAIMNSETLTGVQQRIMVDKLLNNLKLSS